MNPDRQLHLKSILHPGRPLIVDSFAGGGGASTGIALALGREPDIAINHDKQAVEMHQANHPQTAHFCESVWEVDPLTATGGNPVGLAWFSPDCKHFSKAKGSKPKDKGIRGLAWVVIHWVNQVKPAVIMLENVEEFQDWCPLDSDGNPRKEWRKGWFFRCFVGALRRRGYTVDTRELRACDYGAPTIRKRLFLIARCDGQPIVWPEPTHGKPESEGVKSGKLLPWRTASECIDWAIPCPSIFERKKPLAEKTCKRIAKGIMRFVVESEKPFIVATRNGERPGQAPRVRDIDEPYWTVTAQGSQGGLVVPHVTKFRPGSIGHSVDEPLHTVTAGGACKRPAGAAHAMGIVSAHLTEFANGSSDRVFAADEPLRTQCAEVKGGHYALVAAFLAKHYGGVVGVPMTAPTGAVTARDSHSVVAANLTKFRGANVGHAADEPLHTISAGGNHFADTRALLVKYYGNEKETLQLTDPMHTVTSKDRFALVTIDGEPYAIADIGLRMLAPRELYRAQGFPEDYVIGDQTRGETMKLTKSDQVRMCGNSVCPPLAAALARANAQHLAAPVAATA
jgi:DNA (cytosine-5)-methyltransferase 1